MSPDEGEILRWLEKAHHDRRVTELALAHKPPITDVAAFHAQQAVEKLLKAYLVYRREPFEKIHDLEELINRCLPHDPAFAGLRERVSALTPYAVRFRYPGPGDPTVEQVRSALSVVNEVWTFVAGRIPVDLQGN